MCDPPLISCPSCQKQSLERVLTIPYVAIKKSDGEITIGHLANRNSQRFSDDQKGHLLNKDKSDKSVPDRELPTGMSWAEKQTLQPTLLDKYQTASHKEINKMTDKQKDTYIKTGNK